MPVVVVGVSAANATGMDANVSINNHCAIRRSPAVLAAQSQILAERTLTCQVSRKCQELVALQRAISASRYFRARGGSRAATCASDKAST